jgi:hypothetical protein
LKVLVDYNIKLTPVLSKNEKTVWQAGFRRLHSDGWTNVVLDQEFAEGNTPIEAVEKLLSGNVVHPRKRKKNNA